MCCAARGRVSKVERAHPLTFANPRTRVFSADHQVLRGGCTFEGKDLNFDLDYFSMKRANTSSSSNAARGGASRLAFLRTLALASFAATGPAPSTTAPRFDFGMPPLLGL